MSGENMIGSTGRLKSKIFGPLLSVRYVVRGQDIVSAGPPGVSGLSKKLKSAEKRLVRYEVGKAYPCWFDHGHWNHRVAIRGTNADPSVILSDKDYGLKVEVTNFHL